MDDLEKIKTIFAVVSAANNEIQPLPGLSEQEILSAFDSVGLTPPQELVELYKWHDGIYYLNAFLSLLPLGEALEIYNRNKELKEEIPDLKWGEDWHAVLDQNADYQIYLDMNTLKLYSVDIESNTTIQIAEHYKDYLDAMLFILQSGQYNFDETAGIIEVPEDIWKDILMKYNIKAAWTW